MIIIPNNQCNNNLVVKIETPVTDWSFMYDVINDISIQIATIPSQYPIPYGTTITDHIERQMDTITIDGQVSCFRCGGNSVVPTYVISRLKQLTERIIYCTEDFVTLTSNHWQFRTAILTGVTIDETQSGVQTKSIRTTWVGANLTGTIRDPYFRRGGIVYTGF